MDSTIGHDQSSAEIWLTCTNCRAECLDRDLITGQFLRCSRCGTELKNSSGGKPSIFSAWAFSTTALILMVLANTSPILKFEVIGNFQENLIISGIESLWNQGFQPIAALVFFSAIAAPTLYLLSVCYVSATCSLGLRWRGRHICFSIAQILESWNLMPVFAIACVVSVVKLRTLGNVTWEPVDIWIALLSIFTLLTIQCFDRRFVLVQLQENP
jgi:paraquat-inducible protein A